MPTASHGVQKWRGYTNSRRRQSQAEKRRAGSETPLVILSSTPDPRTLLILEESQGVRIYAVLSTALSIELISFDPGSILSHDHEVNRLCVSRSSLFPPV
jgi:hypothetical protein